MPDVIPAKFHHYLTKYLLLCEVSATVRIALNE